MRRLFLISLATLALAGCDNRLSTDTAVLTAADRSGVQLRSGLWRVDDRSCEVDEEDNPRDWPDCAEWMLVRDGEMLTLGPRDDDHHNALVWKRAPYVLAGGSVQALQVRQDDDFSLYGVRALETDDNGRATRISRWTIACGPEEPTSRRNDDGTREKSIRPLPGVRMVGDHECRPEGADGLLAAARADEETAERLVTLRWVRGGAEPGDVIASAGQE